MQWILPGVMQEAWPWFLVRQPEGMMEFSWAWQVCLGSNEKYYCDCYRKSEEKVP